MDYSKLSDFEINEAVSMTLLPKSKNPDANYVAIGNYCNNPADAWPIIQEHGIGIMPFKNSLAKAWPLSDGLLGNTNVGHKNPLRAAMIVYLMMQEGE